MKVAVTKFFRRLECERCQGRAKYLTSTPFTNGLRVCPRCQAALLTEAEERERPNVQSREVSR